MRHILSVIAALAIVMWAVTPAHAISLSLDIPYSNEIKGTGAGSKAISVDSVGGYILGVSTPWFVGVAHEDYSGTVTFDNSDGTKTNVKLATAMNDIYVELPVPVISAAIGYGVGSSTFSAGGGSQDYDATQYFARLGLRLAMIWDVHVGYHKGNAKFEKSGKKDEFDFTTMTLGVGVGF